MKKRYIALSVFLIIIGLALCVVALCLSGFRFLDMFDGNDVQKTYEIKGEITSLYINDLNSDVEIRKSPDGVSKIVYFDNNRYTTDINEENGKLTISSNYHGKWYNYISMFSSDKDAIIYLNKDVYDSLYVDSDTADIKNTVGVSFNTVNIVLSTGDVYLNNMNVGDISIEVSTGDINLRNIDVLGGINLSATTGGVELSNVKCGALDINTDTGDVDLDGVIAKGAINIEVSTGDMDIEGCDAAELYLKASTGDIEGYLLTDKTFIAHSSSGKVRVPKGTTGGICNVTTSTGDIELSVGDRD